MNIKLQAESQENIILVLKLTNTTTPRCQKDHLYRPPEGANSSFPASVCPRERLPRPPGIPFSRSRPESEAKAPPVHRHLNLVLRMAGSKASCSGFCFWGFFFRLHKSLLVTTKKITEFFQRIHTIRSLLIGLFNRPRAVCASNPNASPPQKHGSRLVGAHSWI